MISTSPIYREAAIDSLIELCETSNFESIPIFEVSKNAPKILKKLEQVFGEYLEPKANFKAINKKAGLILSGFADAKITFSMTKQDIGTAYVYPHYSLSTDSSVRTDIKIFENLKHIKKADIVVDYKLFYKQLKLTPPELVGIILHELGHLSYHTSFVPNLFKNLLRLTLSVAAKLNFVAWLLKALPTQSVRLIGITILLCSRTLSVFEHKEEYKCDQYAVKYGYGDELASAFIKLKEFTSGKYTSKRNIFSKMFNYVSSIFNTSTHPSDINRICRLSKAVQKDYHADYPFLKKTLSSKLNLIDCQ